MPRDSLSEALDRAFWALRQAREEGPAFALGELGRVVAVSGGIARVVGLPGVRDEELVAFGGGLYGLALDLNAADVAVALLGDAGDLVAGRTVARTGRIADVPVGDGLLGRVLDPLGRPLDGGPFPPSNERWPCERPAPAIMDRAPVSDPLQTGLKVIDALIPIGHGQRELILGDRQTGKTAVALDAILNQPAETVSVYCAVGQRGSAVARVVAALREHGALDRTVVVSAGGEEAPGMRYLAPFAATTVAEFFMARGRDVLIVYDDLTRHAWAYRELSLLMRRPPGREAFPGDVFYLHARLLERATHLRPEAGGGSLTALPIVETEAQNVAAYIPTNLISITDGQIVLSPERFRRGELPAVDVGLSVSRVGAKAQLPVFQAIAGHLKLAYAQFEELEAFERFGARLEPETRRRLAHGRRIRSALMQPQFQPLPVLEQVAVMEALVQGLFDAVAEPRLPEAEAAARRCAEGLPVPVREALVAARPPGPDALQALRSALEAAIAPFREAP